MKKAIVWLPALILMAAIFYFSSQPARVSGNLSGGVAYKVVSVFDTVTGQNWNETKKTAYAQGIDHPVRKMAHLTEYALLGGAIAFGMLNSFSFGMNWRKFYIFTQFTGSIYAGSDEFHQLFVPGRAGRMSDVLIDSIGIFIGLWICSRIYIYKNRIKVRPS